MTNIIFHDTPSAGENLGVSSPSARSPYSPSKRSQLVELIKEQRLTDLIELSGLTGQDALLAIQVAQCWLCGGKESTVIPAIADDLKPSRRCADCDCFLGVAGGGAE